jgi:DHA1 family tetracycline resistance protein-like MFS transporter
MYGLFVLPESLAPERRSPFAWRSANPAGALRLLRSHPELKGLAAAKFLADLAHAVLPAVFVLYASYRYAWDERDIGITLAVVGVCSLVVQAGLIGPIVRRFGERRALLFGLMGGVSGFAVAGLAETGWWFFAGIPLLALWGIAGPATNGLMTRQVGPSEQGRLQGANSSIQGIANLAGPFLFTLTFSFFISAGGAWHQPGAPFLLAALLLFAAAMTAWRATRG